MFLDNPGLLIRPSPSQTVQPGDSTHEETLAVHICPLETALCTLQASGEKADAWPRHVIGVQSTGL